jgi:hypothetical protein
VKVARLQVAAAGTATVIVTVNVLPGRTPDRPLTEIVSPGLPLDGDAVPFGTDTPLNATGDTSFNELMIELPPGESFLR